MPAWRSVVFLFVAAVVLLCSSHSFAATIAVERDGSGDFTTIQPALDAAASGDTIRIGPGEYTESEPSYIPGYSWDVSVFGFVRVADLTIIGAGESETLVGPTVYSGSASTYSPKGVVWLEGTALRISGLTIQNCYEGMHASNGPIFVDDCRFTENYFGILWSTRGHGGAITGCEFESTLPGGPDGVWMLGVGYNAAIENCEFLGCKVSIQDLDSCSVRYSVIHGSAVGLQVDNGTHCVVDNCRIYDCDNAGVALLSSGTSCVIVDCEVASAQAAVSVDLYCDLTAMNTVFTGGNWAAVHLQNATGVTISDCHLLHGTGPTIRSYCHPSLGEITYDLRNNYWGTADANEIHSLILDGTDDPENSSIVLFEPFHGGSVSTDNTSWDQLKAYFR